MFAVLDVLKVIASVHNSNVMVHLNVQISQMKTTVILKTAPVVLDVLKDFAYLQIGSVMEQSTVQIFLMKKIVQLKILPVGFNVLKEIVYSSALKVIAFLHN